jgi:hypothetical protein
MFGGKNSIVPLVLVTVSLGPGIADCSAQMIGQSIPDGTAVEVRTSGQTRRGVVNGYMGGEYRVQYEGGALNSEWVPAGNVHPVEALSSSEPRKADLAPLYQAIGAAMCPVALVGVLVILVVARAGRRRTSAQSPFQSGPYPPPHSP